VYVAPGLEEIPEPDLESINNIGEATISFSRSMKPIKNLTELKNATVELDGYGVKPAIEVEVFAGNDTDQSQLEFEYEITSFEEDEMVITLNFTNAKEVSINRLPDNLKVTFWAWNLFVDANGTTFKPVQIRLKSLPTQIPHGQISILKDIGVVA